MAKSKTWLRNGIITEGAYSTIFLCTNLQNNKKFIAKTILAHDLEQRTAIEIERKMYKGAKPIQSPYFPRYLGFNIEKKCKEMGNVDVCNLYLEWVPRGSVLNLMNRQNGTLEEPQIAVFCRDICRGLAYLHGQGKIHGDIKAANVLIGTECLKLCDLGSGKILADGDVLLPPRRGWDPMRKRIYTTGTDGWKAPEVEDEFEQGPPSDVYSLGCTLVEMATGDPPQRCPRIFMSKDPKDINPETGVRRSTIDISPNFSKECFQFMEACMAENPRDRPSAAKLLTFPWFQKNLAYVVPAPGTRREPEQVESGCGSVIGC